MDVSVELKDWLFALEGAQEMTEKWLFSNQEDLGREERSWHTTFESLRVMAKSNPTQTPNEGKLLGMKNLPVELVVVRNPFLLFLSSLCFRLLCFYF